MIKSAKVIVLLELVKMIKRKGQNIESQAIVIAINNRKVCRDLLHKITKSNQVVWDTGAEVMKIKKLL